MRAAQPQLNQWGLSGDWTVGGENAALIKGRPYRLSISRPRPASRSRPGDRRQADRFRVTIDGVAPGADHGADIDADGQGAVDGQRLYQLVRQNGRDLRSHLRDRVSRSRRPGLRVHFRLRQCRGCGFPRDAMAKCRFPIAPSSRSAITSRPLRRRNGRGFCMPDPCSPRSRCRPRRTAAKSLNHRLRSGRKRPDNNSRP